MYARLTALPSVAMVLAVLSAVSSVSAQPPAPPEYVSPLIDDLAYASDAALRDAWRPMGDSAAAQVVERDGRRALRLPCKFQGTTGERASWDRRVKLDLAACRGVRFDFYCPDVTPVSHFSLYMHSQGGWYSASFGPTDRAGWSTVVIDKSDTRIEEQPAGWGAIDTIRISAWRGKDVDTEFYIANLAVEGADAPIAIVRGEARGGSSRGEAESMTTFAKNVAGMLDQLGLPYVMISEADVTAERLQAKRVVILPHNPGLPDTTTGAVAEFVERGGKLLAFYSLPAKLAKIAGVGGGAHLGAPEPGYFASIRATSDSLPGLPTAVGQASWNIRRTEPVAGRSRVVATWFNERGESTGEAAIVASENCVFMTHVLLLDDPVAKRSLLLALLGHLDRSLWQLAATNRLERCGRLGAYKNFEDAVQGIRGQAGGAAAALAALTKAQQFHRDAVHARDAQQYNEALLAIDRASQSLLEAYCAAQKPQAGEHRAWWCHSEYGVTGMSWDEAIKTLADNGFTAILPNMLWGGVAFYNSDVLPVAAGVRENGDQIAECLAACEKYGVECHVWKVNWNMGRQVSAEFMEQMRSAGRTQVSYSGTAESRWLCPSHPANQQLEIDSMVEVAAKYRVQGIHFDYIRYPGGDHCFCSGCRERFETELGHTVAQWPADTRRDPAVRQKWLDFRRNNITKVVAGVHERVRKERPNVKISAAVFRNWPVDRDGVGQDWKLWCERGYLDFVCPMDYTPNDIEFETVAGQQLEWAGSVPCYPGIGLSTWSGDRDVVGLIEQIKITRKLGTGGFTVFNYGRPEATQIVPLCGQGITRRD